MKVVIDTNVLIDALKPNTQFEVEAQEILWLASKKEINGFVCANSLTDTFYVLRKKHGAEKTKMMIKKLLLILDVVGIEGEDCVIALEKPMHDCEDALIDVCAQKISADCVVSRDEAFIKATAEVEVMRPDQLLASVK
jgi:predicted nucleic acid-binding protein